MRRLRLGTVGFALLTAFAADAGLTSVADAQQMAPTDGRQWAINQFTPPGTAGQWALQAGVIPAHHFQPVRITLPSQGLVTLYDGSLNRPVALAAPAQAGLLVGRMYRFQVSQTPEFPHEDFFPSIELVDRLHPPPGQAERFPVEIELLEEELSAAARGRMITKVVYLEQPNRVQLQNLDGGPRVQDLAPGQNAIAEADALGRPIAIVRLGGRTPDPNFVDPTFWGPLLPIRLSAAPVPNPMANRDQGGLR